MSTDTASDVRALEALDFAIVCEPIYGCDRTATWIRYIHKSCGCNAAGPRCDEHRRIWLKKNEQALALGLPWCCHLCGAYPITFTDRWEPLHG